MRFKILLILVVVSSVVYANSINNDFVYDDKSSIVDNPYIRDISNIPGSFIHPEYLTSAGIRNHYRPLVVVSHTINYAIGGLNPAVYRITNLLFHIGTAFLLFLTVDAVLCYRVESREQNFYIALASALIFAVHPFNSEAVNYIVARSSLLSGFFYLLAFYCWVQYRKVANMGSSKEVAGSRKNIVEPGSSEQVTGKDSPATSYLLPATLSSTRYPLPATFYIASLLAFLLGMLSKEVVITLPVVLWLYDLYFIHPLRTFLNWRTYIPYLPFILFLALPLIMRAIHAEGGIIPPFKRDIGAQIYTVLPVLVGYLKLMFMPTGLTIAHQVEIYRTPLALSVIFSAVILLFYILNAAYLYIRKETECRLLSFFMFWYFITLLVILIVPLNSIMQENRSYISGAGFALFTGIILWKLVYSRQGIKFAYGLLAVLTILYSAGTVYRNTAWKNGVAIWTDAMEKSPFESLVYNNLSVAYKDVKDYDKAKEVLKRGITLLPDDWMLHYNLGIAYKITGELDSALYEFDRALRIRPDSAAIYTMMGSVYIHKGEIKEAMSLLDTAINGKPDYAPAHYYKAKALLTSGWPAEAKWELELALHYANMSYDRNLVERIKGYIKEGSIEKIRMEDLSMPLNKKENL